MDLRSPVRSETPFPVSAIMRLIAAGKLTMQDFSFDYDSNKFFSVKEYSIFQKRGNSCSTRHVASEPVPPLRGFVLPHM